MVTYLIDQPFLKGKMWRGGKCGEGGNNGRGRQKEKGSLRNKTFAQRVLRAKKLRYPRHMDMNLKKGGEFSPKYRPLQPRRMWTAEDKKYTDPCRQGKYRPLQTRGIETPTNKENIEPC